MVINIIGPKMGFRRFWFWH